MLTGSPKVIPLSQPCLRVNWFCEVPRFPAELTFFNRANTAFILGECLILSGNLLNHLLPVQIVEGTFEYS